MPLTRDDTGSNSWTEYRQLVMATIDELKSDTEDLRKQLSDFQLQMTVDITTLKTKASVWGGIVGAIISMIISIVISVITKKGA